MKNLKNIILSLVFVFAASYSMAQSGPSDPPGGGAGSQSGNPPVGGNAHIGGGLCILLTIGLAYGGRKLYSLMSEKEEGGSGDKSFVM